MSHGVIRPVFNDFIETEVWEKILAECTVMGIPSVTTNLSGFGCFVEKQVPDHDSYGIFIVDRKNKAVDESIQQLANTLQTFW